jgi:dihydrofolate reductase
MHFVPLRERLFMKKNIVFIAKSLDGYIAGKNGELDWLNSTPNPDNSDMGFVDLMGEIDAVVMGRTTYETVIGFNVEWPYKKHVFVLSNTLNEVQEDLKERVTLMKGELNSILETIHEKGFHTLYIDGGRTIQSFLQQQFL